MSKNLYFELPHIRAIADMVKTIGDPDDAQFLSDMIEGETDANEIMDMLLDEDATIDAFIEANKARIKEIQGRNDRLSARKQSIRQAMQKICDASKLKKWDRPLGVVSVRAVSRSLIDGPTAGLPAHLIRTTIEPDRMKIKEALKNGEYVQGWALDNGGETISIRRK